MTTVTINGHTYSDDSNPTTGLGAGGHRTRFVPLVADVVVVAGQVADDALISAAAATAAAASAASAFAAPGTSGSSTSSLALGTGAKSLAVQAGKSWVPGGWLMLYNDASHWMYGQITAYDPGTGALEVAVAVAAGAGTFAAWTVSLSGPPGATDWAGLQSKPTIIGGGQVTEAIGRGRAYFYGGM